MESSAPFPRFIGKPRPGLPSDAELIHLLDTELRSLARTHPGDARRLAKAFTIAHKSALRLAPAPSPRQQLALFSDPTPRPSFSVVHSTQVVPIGTPFLLEEHPGRCPRCREPLVQRSRVGARLYYTCMVSGCLNQGAIFIEILGTGDD